MALIYHGTMSSTTDLSVKSASFLFVFLVIIIEGFSTLMCKAEHGRFNTSMHTLFSQQTGDFCHLSEQNLKQASFMFLQATISLCDMIYFLFFLSILTTDPDLFLTLLNSLSAFSPYSAQPSGLIHARTNSR